jgi:hypothetical protein
VEPVIPAHLPPERRDQIVARAKEIIAGRRPADPMVEAAGVETFLRHEADRFPAPLDPAARRRIADALNLQAHYGGLPVACFTTAEGVLAVLAAGESEVDALFQGLGAEEAARVVVHYPDVA